MDDLKPIDLSAAQLNLLAGEALRKVKPAPVRKRQSQLTPRERQRQRAKGRRHLRRLRAREHRATLERDTLVGDGRLRRANLHPRHLRTA